MRTRLQLTFRMQVYEQDDSSPRRWRDAEEADYTAERLDIAVK
jgi:hypothetical protein